MDPQRPLRHLRHASRETSEGHGVIGSLFSGYGGLDLATQQVLGLPLAFVSDIEPGPRKILAHHHPDVPNLGDVTQINWAPWRGRVDVLTGGFPCTDVSLAGRRAGLIRGETRSGLWAHMHRAISELRPRLVVVENVGGLLSAKADSEVEPCPWCVGDKRDSVLRALGAVLGDLADVGYDAEWVCLRASDVGACHRRLRVFIAAYPEGQLWWLTHRDEEAASDTDSSDIRGREATRLAGEAGPSTRPPLTLLPTPDATGRKATRTGPLLGGALLPTPRASDGEKGGPNQRGSSGDPMLPSAVTRFGDYTLAVRRHERLAGRPPPDPTEPAPRGGQRLSARFVEWMMCLPDGWVTDVPGLTHRAQLRALGNGVVPPQAEAALRYLLAAPLEATA